MKQLASTEELAFPAHLEPPCASVIRPTPMRILIAHNTYQWRGGEDIVFEQESAMLEANGFAVRRFKVDNDHIRGLAGKLAAARSVIANKALVAALCAEIDAFRPDLVHFHNFFPTLSPAAVQAVARRGIPAVVTLHNYRLICAGGLLMRDCRPCEDCISHSRLPGVRHGCYRDSQIGSALVAGMAIYFRRLLDRHPHEITLLALTAFAKSRFVAAGFAPERIMVRGNVIADPGAGQDERERRVVYVGRLSVEKGVDTLLNAVRGLDCTVEIIGDGPERARLEAIAGDNVVFLGQQPTPVVMERVKAARLLAVPSRWYEGFPVVVLEAMAAGTPVLASRIGSLAEIVQHERTGLLLPPNDTAAWRDALMDLLCAKARARGFGEQGRARFLEKHSTRTGIESLSEIYALACEKIEQRSG
jgi:glycosyltransferase involved in cell wall biosynthesis